MSKVNTNCIITLLDFARFENTENMKVLAAKYIEEYKIEIVFDDNKKNVVNFFPVLKKYSNCKKYLDINLFKKFKIDEGNIVWGNNWEMIFKVENLYENKFD